MNRPDTFSAAAMSSIVEAVPLSNCCRHLQARATARRTCGCCPRFGSEGMPPDQFAAETRALQVPGVVLLPPMQAGGLVSRNELHVEGYRQPGTTLWHLNREGNDIVVQRILPEIEKIIARLPRP